ncbi:thioredoxin family protein [Chryseobacterium sp. BIGb0232]|uniref:DUF1223 domain-containing protein n=1 Tax=Chryseobacterium sp. BIGb0232 TaxID=2940598 RepID=UPI000F4ACFFF|nr:DUF1223 domain-containing protein [Chryseobacterium sp. BIGb0232]MCS4300748.1 hypothetical protein [Chryseobacterium sp. BIGb0232]ROS20372.1 hypothetical protein EDF65_1089 [Chryseobacterium nakagawai]
MILKNVITTGVLTLSLFSAFAFVQKDGKEEVKQNPATEGNGFAVLELFTSEGCSSCPPADELMGKIEKEYKNKNVYILSYHVDYWNRLGWKDRFSSAENSQRQQLYSRLLNSQVYTPQLVVNGKTEFVGSDENTLSKALQTALSGSQNTNISLSAKVTQHEIHVQYDATAITAKDRLLVSLVEKQSSTHVGKGENEGRHLQHWQIVHQQNSIALNTQQKGVTAFQVPQLFSAENWEVIAFIQNSKTGEISGTAKIQF